ncbi:ABC transporter, ATP-binding protein [Winkia neuii]|nr:ABC transporter, ATP-binding protein [Winkia neuii]
MVAGLEPTTSGRILIGGKDMTGARPRSRDVAMVFQSYALYPNMTVAQNMAFALENAKVDRATITERVGWAAKMLQLTDLLERKPAALSGGQRQRVAMGRAIVRKPTVFCMDEPLSNLDAKLRVSMRGEIAALQRDLGVTTVYVTHDQVEAMTMGHRVAVMKEGVLQQVATPTELYNHPVNTFVAGFIGSPAISLFDCPVTEEGVHLGSLLLPLPHQVAAQVGKHVCIGVRPEGWDLVGEGEGLRMQTDLVEVLGSQNYLHAKPTSELRTGSRVAVMIDRHTRPASGEPVWIRPNEQVLFFDPEDGTAL